MSSTQQPAKPVPQSTEGLDFRNKSFYDADFSKRDLRRADYRGATLHNCNFDNSDLAYADFSGADCYRSTFRMTKLRCVNFMNANLSQTVLDPRDFVGSTVTITCNTMAGARVGKMWVSGWLQYLLLANIDPMLKEKIRELAESQVGPEAFKKMQEIFPSRSGL